MKRTSLRLQSSFELLITVAVGLAILLPIVAIAFIQIANANSSLSSIEAQQAATKLAGIATLVGSEGPPAKQVAQIQIPTGVRYIYVGTLSNGVGHEIVFVVSAPTGVSYVTAYTPVNVSGNLGGIVSAGTYLINATALSACPTASQFACVYMTPVV
jgi:hypothetical protein